VGDAPVKGTPAAAEEPAARRHTIDRILPGVAMLRTYKLPRLRFDVVAGIVLAAILVPQGLAYAELAGLPPVTGLYTTIACLVVYALLGPSRILVLGPDSAVSPLIFAAIVPLMAGGDTATAIALAGMLALLVGAIEIGLGVGKLGFIADLLSKEVQVGYMNGLAVVIVVGQLPKLFGFSTDASGFLAELKAFFTNLDQTDVTTLLVGLGTLALLLGLPRLSKKIPAVLVAVVAATAVSAAFDLAAHGVTTIGTLPQGLPAPSLPWTSASDLVMLTAAAVGIVLVSLTDTIATSSSFAAKRGDEVDANHEMIAVGASNAAAGLFQGFAISVSASRTAVAESAGAKTQVTGLVGAGLVITMLVAVPSLLAALPATALAAVVIVAAISLMDIAALRRFARVRRTALALSLVASVGVIFFGVLQGILVAAILSILLFFRRNWWPPGAVLGYVEELKGWHDVEQFPDAEQQEGVVIYRWEAPLFFANAGIFRQTIRSLVRRRQPRWIVLQCEAITDIDVTAADVLKALDHELDGQGIHIAFVELRTRLQERVEAYGLLTELDREHFFAKIKPALKDIAAHEPGADEAPHRWMEAPD
jgi:high affinity sulfate transporter 1